MMMEVLISDVALGALAILCPDHIMGSLGAGLRDRRNSHSHQKSILLLFSVQSAFPMRLTCNMKLCICTQHQEFRKSYRVMCPRKTA